MKQVAIVVPIYNEKMTNDGLLSFKQLLSVLNNYPIFLVHPEGLNIGEYLSYNNGNIFSKPFNPSFFTDRMDYAKMCCTPQFYKTFSEYEYMLIYQLDCWVFRDELKEWCDKGYDYIGAPFFIKGFMEKKQYVGNGGFSLRKNSSIIKYLEKHNDPSLPNFNTDDGFFAQNLDNDLNIATFDDACLFSFEQFPDKLYKKTGKIPFGCHAFKKYNWNFWKKYIKMERERNKILFDSQAFDIQKFGGVSKVFGEIVNGVRKNNEVELSCLACDNVYLKNSGIADTKSFTEYLHKTNQLDNSIQASQINWYAANKKESLKKIKEGNFDVFHATHYDPYYINEIGNKPYIVTIHDMTDIVYKDYRLWDEEGWKRELQNRMFICSKAAKVVCISEQTKKDVIKYIGVEESRIRVINNAYDPIREGFQYKKVYDFPYLMYVGTRQGIYNYKGFIPFITQAASFLHRHKEFKVICTGGGNFTKFEKHLFQQLGIEGQVIQRYVDEDTLNNLYHFAFCYVFPSEYEGFGLPILEAWKNNCITLLNNEDPVFHEIAIEGSSLWFSFKGNEQTNTLNDSLERLFNMSEEEKNKIREMAAKRLQDYSWGKVCDEYNEVYKEVLK